MQLSPARFAVYREGFWAERGWLLLSIAAWLLFAWVTISLPLFDSAGLPSGGWHFWVLGVAPQYLSIPLGVLTLLAIVMAGERAYWSPTARWIIFGTGATLTFLPWAFQLNQPQLKPLVAIGLMLIALPIGYWIGDRMEKVTNLIPLAVAMSLADIFSVYQGPSKEIASQVMDYQAQVSAAVARGGPDAIAGIKAPIADYIFAHFAIAGTGATLPVLGVGDFVILAFLYRAAWVHHISPRLILGATFISIVAALIVSELIRAALPALPFIALGTLAALWLKDARIRRLDRQELVLSVAVCAIFGTLIGAKALRSLF